MQITEQPADTAVLEGSAARFAVKALNARSYQWQRLVAGVWQDLAGQQADVLQLPSVGLSDAGAQFRVQLRGDTETLISASATLSVSRKVTAAAITVQPASDALADGEVASWSVTATGTDLSYQWQRSTDGTNWADVPGATAATWSPGKVSLTDDGLRVRVVVRNTLATVTSAVATLEVFSAPAVPTIAQQPQDTRVIVGQLASFEAQVLGKPTPTLQWQRSINGSQWDDVPQAQSAHLQLPAVSAGDDGSQFRLKASNRAGQVLSQVVRLTVRPVPQALVWQSEPQSLRVGIGQDAVFAAEVAGGAPATLQWQLSRDGGKSWQTLAGANTARLVIASASSREAGNWYRAQASNEVGQITSRAAQLQLDAQLQMRLLFGDGRGAGHRDGPLLDAKFDFWDPFHEYVWTSSLAQDAKGDLFVAIKASRTVRKIDFATGRVITLAGAPYEQGDVDGPATSARFFSLGAITVDKQGQVFVVDSQVGSTKIRVISPTGMVSTLVTLNPAEFYNVRALAIHPLSGELFFSNLCGIYRVSRSEAGVAVTQWSGFKCGVQTDGPRDQASWWGVTNFEFEANGDLLVEDGARIRRVYADGRVETPPYSDPANQRILRQPRRASDGALFAIGDLNAWQSVVFAYPASQQSKFPPTVRWDAAAGRLIGGELIAGAVSVSEYPGFSKALTEGYIFLRRHYIEPGAGGWLLGRFSYWWTYLWQIDRDGRLSTLPLDGINDLDGLMMILPDQVLSCQSDAPLYTLISLKKDGSKETLATWDDHVSGDITYSCVYPMWDASRGRLFVRYGHSEQFVYDLKAKRLIRPAELGLPPQGEWLAVGPQGALLVNVDGDRLLKLFYPDGSSQVLPSDGRPDGRPAVDAAGAVFTLMAGPGATRRIVKLRAGSAPETVVSWTVNSTEPGSRPSWRGAFALAVWGPDQLLVITDNELTVLDVPSGVDCGCSPPAKAALARKAALMKSN